MYEFQNKFQKKISVIVSPGLWTQNSAGILSEKTVPKKKKIQFSRRARAGLYDQNRRRKLYYRALTFGVYRYFWLEKNPHFLTNNIIM